MIFWWNLASALSFDGWFLIRHFFLVLQRHSQIDELFYSTIQQLHELIWFLHVVGVADECDEAVIIRGAESYTPWGIAIEWEYAVQAFAFYPVEAEATHGTWNARKLEGPNTTKEAKEIWAHVEG